VELYRAVIYNILLVVQITTWSPDTCSCEFSFTWDDEDVPRVHTFYAVHNVCALHEHLATKTLHSLHSAKVDKKMEYITHITMRNLRRHEEKIAQTTRRMHKRDLVNLTTAIHDHNQRVKDNFEDIFSEPHAHDEHIYSAVLAENQLKNRALGHIQETHGIDADWEFDKSRKLILKVDKDKVNHVINTIKNKFDVSIQSK
jgi:hypothetical protein